MIRGRLVVVARPPPVMMMEGLAVAAVVSAAAYAEEDEELPEGVEASNDRPSVMESFNGLVMVASLLSAVDVEA